MKENVLLELLSPVEQYCFAQYFIYTITTDISLFFSPDVHSDGHTDRLSEPECIRVSGDAVHAQSLHHYPAPGTKRAQTQAQLQGHRHCSHHDKQTQPASQ